MPTPARNAWIEAWEGDLTPSAAAARSAARAHVRVRSSRYYSREATARVPEPLQSEPLQPAPQVERQRPLPEPRLATRRRPLWGTVAVTLALCAVLLGGAIVAPVLVNSAVTGTESEVGQMEAMQRDLVAATTALSSQISALSSPERVAEQANRLGLGPAQSVRYLDLGTETAAMEGETTVAGR